MNTIDEGQLSPPEAPPVVKPRKSVSGWIGLAALTLIFGLIWMNQDSAAPAVSDSAEMNGATIAARVGSIAPDFSLVTLTGEQVHLSDFQGKPVILNFWATWCPPCREEMPALEAIWQQYGAGDVVVLGVDQGESVAVVERFIHERVGTTFPILMDSNHAVGNSYFVRSLPTTFFIDRNGFIQEIHIGGPLSLPFLQEQVRKLGG
ncbi:MAG: TlpA family protein disulfide reductase [Caldilineaceae bacterium]|nr:TlpA family protein disulfide reductase [Caldilineaceae bacterium]